MLGPLLVFVFVLLSAVCDVYFRHIFQPIGLYKVVLIACTTCTLFLLLLTVLPGALAVLKDNVLAVTLQQSSPEYTISLP